MKENAPRRPPLRVLPAELCRSAVLLAGVGAVAVGVSGAVAAVIRAVSGSRALVDVAPGRTLSAADCARWLAAVPHAADCRAAAVADWADETVYYRLALGVVGMLLLLAYRRLRRGHEPTGVVAVVRDAVGHTAFALATVGTLVVGVAARHAGAGQWLSATPVALGGAGVFAVLLLRDLRRAETAR